MIGRRLLLLAAAGLLGGCAPPPPAAQLSSFNARDRAAAAVALAERGEPQAVHQLIPLLEDSDAAVRMYAILALQRLTGETFGYRFYDDFAERQAAVSRWRDALREGRVTLSSGGAP